MVDRTPVIATLLRQKPAAAEGRIQGIGRHNATEAAKDKLFTSLDVLRGIMTIRTAGAIELYKPMTRSNARIVAEYLREAGWSEGAIGAATKSGADLESSGGPRAA